VAKSNADYKDDSAAEAWASNEINWGVFGVPESTLSSRTAPDGDALLAAWAIHK
jgi:hypothetical protein